MLSKQHEVSGSGHRSPRVTDLLRGQACWQVVISAVTLHESERWVFLFHRRLQQLEGEFSDECECAVLCSLRLITVLWSKIIIFWGGFKCYVNLIYRNKSLKPKEQTVFKRFLPACWLVSGWESLTYTAKWCHLVVNLYRHISLN